jgi:hypothetical protein
MALVDFKIDADPANLCDQVPIKALVFCLLSRQHELFFLVQYYFLISKQSQAKFWGIKLKRKNWSWNFTLLSLFFLLLQVILHGQNMTFIMLQLYA